jgi:hypothetical protein
MRYLRRISVEYSEGRGAQEAVRFVVVHSSQLAQRQAQSDAVAQAREAAAVADHVQHVQARWFACLPDAEAAIAECAHRRQGQRGRRPCLWRYHAGRYRISADTRRTHRTRRGRPARTDPPPMESGYRLVVEGDALAHPKEDNGWMVLATTVREDAEILRAYQEQHTTVEPGFRWIKNPAAISPVWLEKPDRIAALAMLTVLCFLVSSVIQRQVRLYLRTHDQQMPGNKGETAIPTPAVVLSLFAPIAVVHLSLSNAEMRQVYGIHHYHLMVCEALGLDHTWYEVVDSAYTGTEVTGESVSTNVCWSFA